MGTKSFPVIDLIATGSNIRRLRKERGYTVRDLQDYFGFNEPQAIYKWQRGESLPSVDNLYALGSFFDVPIEQILIPQRKILHIYDEQQAETCCSNYMQKDPAFAGSVLFSAVSGAAVFGSCPDHFSQDHIHSAACRLLHAACDICKCRTIVPAGIIIL